MSAFICNHSHVTALAVYAARHRLLGWTDANQVGELLHAENVKSVNYRYDYREAAVPDFALCEWAAFHAFSHVQIISSRIVKKVAHEAEGCQGGGIGAEDVAMERYALRS